MDRDPAAVLEVRLLGPVEALAGGVPVPLGGARQRALLAALALDAGRVVATARLVEALWGEEPPGTAVTALHGHVSSLRKLLGREAVVTRAPGYLLAVGTEQVDVGRFERLLESGRHELAQGDARAAARTLRSALDMWRGPPLADLREEPVARGAAGRLEELRAAAFEERVEADLELGEGAGLVGELQAAVRADPLRERPRGQLMRALYRSGRQAEALAVYADARRTFAEELGLAPGRALQELERAILEQDPGLEARRPVPARRGATRPPPPRPSWSRRVIRRRRIAAGLTGGGALAAVVAGALLLRGGDEAPRRPAAGPGIASLGPGAPRFVHTGGTPAAVTVGEGAVWMVDGDGQTLRHVEPRSGDATTFAIGATPTDLVAGAGALWVGSGGSISEAQTAGPATLAIARVDPGTRTVRERIRLPYSGATRHSEIISHLAVTPGGLWAINPDLTVSHVDPRSNRVRGVVRRLRARAVAAGREGVWALEEQAVVRIDPRRLRVAQRVRLPATELSGLAVGAGAVWATSRADGTLWRVDPAGRPATRTIEVGSGAGAVAASDGGVWVANGVSGTVTLVDPRTNRVRRTVPLHGTPRGVAIGAGRTWVAIGGGGAPAAQTTSRGVLPGSICGPLVTGGGRPDVVIVSDMPLQGGIRVPVQQMADAISLVLRQHRFRAGPRKVGYQSCDDSVARTGIFDVEKCVANAKAYAAAREVVGVIGAVNSPCTQAEIPVLNRAPEGPLAMVSPLSSYLGLTRAGPGTAAGEPERLYPTGRRNFARVIPTDDRGVAALAMQAKRLGLSRVVVLDDGEPTYSRTLAAFFRRAARRAGVRVVASRRWDPRRPDQRALARRVARLRPDGVMLSGLLDADPGPLVRALRAALGAGPALLATEGFTPLPILFERAGPAARGMYVSLSGVPETELHPAGRRFADALQETQPGVEIEPSAFNAAQAAEAMLAAVARSDGTRASVTRELLRVRLRDGPMGPTAFDANGDLTTARVTILRVQRQTERSRPGEFEGGTIEGILTPPVSLTAGD